MNSGHVHAEGVGELKAMQFTPAEMLYNGTGPYATVSFTLGRSFGYGDLKVSAHVSLQCNQNEEALEEAGKRAFLKAAELLEDGINIMAKRMEPG